MNEAYLYWLVRYVPNVARGEQVNVAVIAGRDEGDWAIRAVPDLRRASRLGGDASGLRPWLASIEQSVHDYGHPPLALFANPETRAVSRAWLELLSHRFNNVLQVSDPAPVSARSAVEAVDFLFPHLVSAPGPTSRSKTRTRLVQNMADLYRNRANLELGDRLWRRPRAQMGRQRGRFDFAVVDDQIGQLSQAFAFDVRDTANLEQELQSWNFGVGRLRVGGGLVLSGGQELRAPADVPVSVAFQEPRQDADAQTHDVFEAALEAWSALGVTAVPSTELGRIAAEAQTLLQH